MSDANYVDPSTVVPTAVVPRRTKIQETVAGSSNVDVPNSLEPEPVYSIPGLKMLMLGSTGSGKTHSITTLVAAGVKPFVLFTEPGMSTLAKVMKAEGIPDDAIAWHYISPAKQDFASMIAMSQNLNRMSYKMISEMTDPNKRQYLQWVEVLRTCEDFIDDRTGEHFGNISEWGADRALVIDSLSGLNDMAMALIVGSRPTRSMPDWMVSQNNLLGFLNKLCTDTQCHFILTGHLEREQDEISGGVQLMASTLGKKLAPKIPRYFDEVVMCKRTLDKFSWSTAENNVDLKARVLPISTDIPPTFQLPVGAWVEAGGVIPSVQDTA